MSRRYLVIYGPGATSQVALHPAAGRTNLHLDRNAAWTASQLARLSRAVRVATDIVVVPEQRADLPFEDLLEWLALACRAAPSRRRPHQTLWAAHAGGGLPRQNVDVLREHAAQMKMSFAGVLGVGNYTGSSRMWDAARVSDRLDATTFRTVMPINGRYAPKTPQSPQER